MEEWAREFDFSDVSPQPSLFTPGAGASNSCDFLRLLWYTFIWFSPFATVHVGFSFHGSSVILLYICLITSFQNYLQFSPLLFPCHSCDCGLKTKRPYCICVIHTHTHILVGFQEGMKLDNCVHSAVLTRNPNSFLFYSEERQVK